MFPSCSMRRLYITFRILGYLFGLSGLVLFTYGRQAVEPRSLMTMAGGVLLVLSFASFVATYVLAIASRLRPRNRPEKPA
jgi:hypothetical protein